MIKIYGSKKSSAGRCHVLLKEIGLEYEEVTLDMAKKEHKSKEFMKLNPNGKVPCLVDGDFVLWESMAINKYLAAKYKPELLGESLENQAKVDQWSYWAIVELQPYLVRMMGKLDEAALKECRKMLQLKHSVLDGHLADKEYLLGDKYTLADINTGSVAGINLLLKNDISEFINIGKWLNSLSQRPSFQ